jgi:hypothetical protein
MKVRKEGEGLFCLFCDDLVIGCPASISECRVGVEPFDHLDQLGQGSSLHLIHRPLAMSFHGVLRNSKAIRSALIQCASSDHGDHVMLSPGEGVKAPVVDR